MGAGAYPSKEGEKGSQGQAQPLGQEQSQMLGQRYWGQQLWWWLFHWAEKQLHWWTEELRPLLNLEEVGQVERGPLGARVGTCLEEKEAEGPGGNWEAVAAVVEDEEQEVVLGQQAQGVVVTGLAMMPAGHPYGRSGKSAAAGTRSAGSWCGRCGCRAVS